MDSEPLSNASIPNPVLSLRPDQTSGELQRIMLLILALSIACTCLLSSAGEGVEAGHVAWRPDSILRVITGLTNLDHRFPTIRGTEVKWLTEGVGAAAALICAAAAWFLRTRQDPDEEPAAPPVASARAFNWLTAMSPVTAAQLALLLFVAWSMFSALWSIWPEASVYEGIRQLMMALLAIAIGRCLTQQSARKGARLLMMGLIITAGIGVWYHYERNPVQRLKYPIGNPIFLAACLLPALPLIIGSITTGLLERRAAGTPDKNSLKRWLGIAALFVGLTLVVWAFVLADSRGPGLGLALGVLVTALLLSSNRRRAIIGSGFAIAVVFAAALRIWPVSWLLSRPDTVRLRLYAWKYALQIFLQRPDVGRGQGAYVLLGQRLSRGDAERDPLAFPGDLLGHAHNEYLEVMADLGAIGLALLLTAIGVTLWGVVIAWRRTQSRQDRCLLVTLTAGFLAILFEACSDVALRMPGLPVILAATWGLLWAACRSDEERLPRPQPQSIRVVGLLAAIAGGWGILTIAARDWQAALAEPPIAAHAQKLQWDAALESAAVASRNRLSTESRLGALYQAVRVAREAAAYRTNQLQEMVVRSAQPGQEPAHVLRLAREDVSAFETYAAICLQAATTLIDNHSRDYPGVASFVSDLWLLRLQIATIQNEVGPIGLSPPGEDLLEQARKWLALEYEAHRLDAELGLRLLSMSEHRPILERLNLLRVPIRGGPILPGVEAALARLMQDPGFGAAMDTVLASARPAVEGETPWPEPYAPESLRLAALANKLRGAFDDAAGMAAQAVRLLTTVQQRFRTNASYALADLAGYLLIADPLHPEPALAAMQEAVRSWPERFQPAGRTELQRLLILHTLAAGHEDEALRLIGTLLEKPPTDAELQTNLGIAYAELCQRFLFVRPDRRSPHLSEWLQKALLKAPGWHQTYLIAATVTLEKGQEDVAVQNLEEFEKGIQDPQRMAVILHSLLTRFPQAQQLRAFAATRLPELAQSVPPAGSESHPRAPATRPGTQPVLNPVP